MVVKTKILAKTQSGLAFRADDGEWYNLIENSPAKPYYDKTEKGDTVEITYEKIKGRNIVSKIKKISFTEKTEVSTSSTDITKTETKSAQGYKPKGGGYGSPEDVLGKQVGCAVGAAASIMSNPSVELSDNSPNGIIAATIEIAEALLKYMQSKAL